VVQVADINSVIAEIAASAQEQSIALGEVNSSVNHMDQMTQQNAAMVEQTTAASHGLADQGAELAALISRFKVGRADQAAAGTPRRSPLPARSRSVQLRTQGSAALKSAPGADENAWEEF
jgi:methyl-accepting chemotaxis protein